MTQSVLIVSSTTPTIMIIDVPPKETFALNSPENTTGISATTVSPIAPIKIILLRIFVK